jgi:hypothetical protein
MSFQKGHRHLDETQDPEWPASSCGNRVPLPVAMGKYLFVSDEQISDHARLVQIHDGFYKSIDKY